MMVKKPSAKCLLHLLLGKLHGGDIKPSATDPSST